MLGKIILARCMSKVLFIVLYIVDIAIIYCLTSNIIYTIFGAAFICLCVAIQMGISLLSLRAHSINNSLQEHGIYLKSCMDEVMNRSVSVGRKRKEIHLWIADNESLNCYTVGHSIVVNKSMLRLGDRTILEGILAHELSHVYNLDNYFATLLELNIFIGLCYLALSLFGVTLMVILIVALVFGIVFSSWVGFTIGTIIGKALKWFFGLIKRGYYYICKAFAALLYRRQEFEADRFAVLLGYSQAMINFFQLLERTKQHAIQTSWIEDLLNDHPSNYRRVVEIQKLNNEINREERETNENLPYENPFK